MSDIDKESIDNIEQNVEKDTIKEDTEIVVATEHKKVKKHLLAKQLVIEAKSILESNEQDFSECKLLLENDLHEYTEAKKALHSGGLDDAKALLVELGFSTISELDTVEENMIFEAKEETPLVAIKDVHSGKFTGFIFSLLAGVTTFGALAYWASEKLGLTLDLSNIRDRTSMDSIANVFSNSLVGEENPILGMAVMGGVSAIVMLGVYLLRISTKGKNNLKLAESQLEETQKYITQKSNCKMEMERVDAHITNAIETLKDYEVLLTEQNAKLKRILHFEGYDENELGYSNHAKDEMKATQNLIETIQVFIAEPMSHEGKLSEQTVVLLDNAKEEVKKIVSKWI